MAIKVGVVGCGVGERWATAFAAQDNVEIAALVHKDDARASALAKTFALPPARVFNGWPALVQSFHAHPLDIIIAANPPRLRRAIVCEALEYAHVAMEKPMAMSLRQASEIYFRSLWTEHFAQVLMPYRHVPGLPPPRPYLDAVHLVWHRRGLPDTPWAKDVSVAGGGILADLGFPAIDVAWHLLGRPALEQAQGVMYDDDGEPIVSGWESGFSGLLSCAGDKRITFDLRWGRTVKDEKLRIECSGSALGAPPGTGRIHDSYDLEADEEFYLRAARAFLGTLFADNRAAQLAATQRGVDVQRCLDGLYQSARHGRSVTL